MNGTNPEDYRIEGKARVNLRGKPATDAQCIAWANHQRAGADPFADDLLARCE